MKYFKLSPIHKEITNYLNASEDLKLKLEELGEIEYANKLDENLVLIDKIVFDVELKLIRKIRNEKRNL